MPKIKVQGINLYYEIHGEGVPLIMIRGLGSTTPGSRKCRLSQKNFAS